MFNEALLQLADVASFLSQLSYLDASKVKGQEKLIRPLHIIFECCSPKIVKSSPCLTKLQLAAKVGSFFDTQCMSCYEASLK